MKVCIHRGAEEVGGTCVEIESQGERIVLDVGLPLDVDLGDMERHSIPGFSAPDPSLLGVVISHPHQDHYGLAHLLPNETRFLVGKAAASILAAAEVFTPSGITLSNVIYLEDRQPITMGPFTITPYLVDHSAYDAYAVLVEADGQRLFYTGDIRAHGRKARLFERLVGDPPQNVDVLLMEGTTIGRDGEFPTETELEYHFTSLFRATPGMALVWLSGQNVDRIVTVFRACKRAGRQLIVDMYTAHVLRATSNPKIPQAGWNGVKVFLPRLQRSRIKRLKAFAVSNLYRLCRIYTEQLAEAAPRSVMLFRSSMICDVEQARCLDGARMNYSMWPGYLERDTMPPFSRWLAANGIPMEVVHTSGHAAIDDLRRLREAFGGAVVVPIHSEQGDRFEELFGNVQRRRDGEWWQLASR
jgi:ribonuclease J